MNDLPRRGRGRPRATDHPETIALDQRAFVRHLDNLLGGMDEHASALEISRELDEDPKTTRTRIARFRAKIRTPGGMDVLAQALGID